MTDTLPFQLVCEECKRRGVACGGVWRFYSQHERYLLQCRTCRQGRRACPFRKLENNGGSQINPREQKGKKRQLSLSTISISSDSCEDSEDSQAVGPSSRPVKKVKVRGDDGSKDERDKDEEALLEAWKEKLELETNLVRVDATIHRLKRKIRGKR